MSVQPYTSSEDRTPYVPGTSQTSGGGATIPVGSQVPDLAMAFTTAPDFSPSKIVGTGGGSGSALPPVSDLSIDLGSLRDAENAMLAGCSQIVNAYESLKSLFESGKDTVFGQQLTDTGAPLEGDSQTEGQGKTFGPLIDIAEQPDSGLVTVPDPLAIMGQAFANGQNGQPGMNDVEALSLQKVGDAMAFLGQFMALMNAAGYAYAQADYNSVLPPAQVSGS